MDTSINSFPLSDAPVLPQELLACQGRATAPLLLDVRREGKFAESPYLIAGAQRCAPEDVAALADVQAALDPQREIVVYCVYGHKVSEEALAILRSAGFGTRWVG